MRCGQHKSRPVERQGLVVRAEDRLGGAYLKARRLNMTSGTGPGSEIMSGKVRAQTAHCKVATTDHWVQVLVCPRCSENKCNPEIFTALYSIIGGPSTGRLCASTGDKGSATEAGGEANEGNVCVCVFVSQSGRTWPG